jgi:hypothetical protein
MLLLDALPGRLHEQVNEGDPYLRRPPRAGFAPGSVRRVPNPLMVASTLVLLAMREERHPEGSSRARNL